MSGVELSTAYVSLIASSKDLGPSTNRAIKGLSASTAAASKSTGSKIGASLARGMKLGIAGATAGGLALLKGAFNEAREAQKVGALTNQVIKSTGGAAKVSAAQVGNLATALSNKVGIDDEAIQSGQNLLLTFTRIRNEQGRGNDIFNQATRIMVDMSAALGTDAKGSAIQLGKALNDPIRGVAALQRVGVSFDESQRKQIKTLVNSGNQLKAQKIILAELSKEFGGAAAAQATAGDKMGVAWGNLKEQIGTALLPTLDKAESFMTAKAIPAVSNFLAEMQTGKGAGGEFAEKLKDIAGIAKDLGGVAKDDLLPPLKTTLEISKELTHWFAGLPGPIKKVGIEVAIAAIAFRKFSPGITTSINGLRSFNKEMLTTEGRSKAGKAALTKLGSAAKAAAGIGGMVALTESAQESNGALSTLESAAGGAATGFAVGGPLGAAIGGTAGALLGLARSALKPTEAFDAGIPAAADYAKTLDDVTGAATRATRELVLKQLASQDGLLASFGKLGISQRDAVDAAMGHADALGRVNAKLNELSKKGKIANDVIASGRVLSEKDRQLVHDALILGLQADTASAAFKRERESLKSQISETREAALATGDLTKVMKGVPLKISTKIVQLGDDPKKIRAKLIELVRAGKLVPEQIKTILRAEGLPAGKKAIDALIAKAKESKTPLSKAGGAAGSAYMNGVASPSVIAKAGASGAKLGDAAGSAATAALNSHTSEAMSIIAGWFNLSPKQLTTNSSPLPPVAGTARPKVNRSGSAAPAQRSNRLVLDGPAQFNFDGDQLDGLINAHVIDAGGR